MRSSGKILFPQLRDGTGVVQCVALKNSVTPEVWDALKGLGQESALMITGRCAQTAARPAVMRSTSSTPRSATSARLSDHAERTRHRVSDGPPALWLRSRRQHAVLKVRHTVVQAVRNFLDNDGFTLADSPIFTPAACEGTTTLFEVDYFDGEKAYLTQSGQLYNEATAAAFGKAYCFGPTFRAEKSKTRRHLTEFWMVEPEMAYATARRRDDFVGANAFIHRCARAGGSDRRS